MESISRDCTTDSAPRSDLRGSSGSRVSSDEWVKMKMDLVRLSRIVRNLNGADPPSAHKPTEFGKQFRELHDRLEQSEAQPEQVSLGSSDFFGTEADIVEFEVLKDAVQSWMQCFEDDMRQMQNRLQETVSKDAGPERNELRSAAPPVADIMRSPRPPVKANKVRVCGMERSAEDLLLVLRAEVEDGFDRLLKNIVEEIKDLRAEFDYSVATSRNTDKSVALAGDDQERRPCGPIESSLVNDQGHRLHDPIGSSSVNDREHRLRGPIESSSLNAMLFGRNVSNDQEHRPRGPIESSSLNAILFGRNWSGGTPLFGRKGSEGATGFGLKQRKSVGMSQTMVDWRGTIRRQTASGSDAQLSLSQKFQHLLDSIPGNREGLLHQCAISGPFSYLCMAMILANAIWLGYEADQNSESATGWQHAVNVSFTLWFIFELAFKVIALQRYFIFGHDWKWNIFDTLLVLVSIPELFASSLNVSIIRMLRLFKLSKALRVLRVMKFVRSLRVIMFTLLHTVGTLFWCFVAMSMFAYTSAILFKQAIAMSLDDGAQFNENTMHTFRSLWSTLFALYGIIANGGDWYGLALDFEDQGAHFAQYLLSLWIFITTFGFLNVVLAVFCAKGTEAIFADVDLWLEMEQERRLAKLYQLAEIFNMIDTKSSGSISWDQFRNFAMGPVGQSYLQSHGLQLFAIKDVWQLMDKYFVEGQDGEVDLSAFVMGFMRLSGEAVGTEIMLLSTKVKALRSEIRDACHELRCDIKRDLDCRARNMPRTPRLPSAPKTVETAFPEADMASACSESLEF